MQGNIYIRYSDLFGAKPTLASLKKELSQFDLENALFHLTQMNVLLGRQRMLGEGRKAMQKLQGLLIANYVDDAILEGKLKPIYGPQKTDEFCIFTRQQALGLIRLISQELQSGVVTADGKTSGGYALGRCSLMMNDHLLSKREERITSEGTDLKKRKHLALQLAPLLELYNPPRLDQAVVRAEILFGELLESCEMKKILKLQLGGFDLARAFQDATGLRLESYREIIVALISWIHGYESEQLLADPNLLTFQRNRFIKDSLLKPADFDRYLSLDSVKIATLRTSFKEKSAKLLAHFDYVHFRSKPLLELDNGSFLCADACFAVEKLSSGIYWTIIDSLKGTARKSAFDAFGHLFEQYVNRIISCASSGDAVFIPAPKYLNGENSFDGLLYHRAERHLIVFEYKASFMKIESKYGGKIRAFEAELDKKFGRGRGVAQLAKHIERLAHKNAPMRHRIKQLDDLLESSHSRIERISPVLIVQEPILRFHIIEWLLSKRFRELLKRKRISNAVNVRPLAVVDIDTLENLKPNLEAGDFSLAQCLNARALRDPDYMQFWPEFIGEHFSQFGRRKDEVLSQKFGEIMDRARRNLFGY